MFNVKNKNISNGDLLIVNSINNELETLSFL